MRLFRRLYCPSIVLLAVMTGCDPLATGPSMPTTTTEPIGRFNTRLSKMDVEWFDTASCQSGEHQSFVGADLRPADGGPIVRIAMDPERGPVVLVFDPADTPHRMAIYHKSDCKKFTVELEDTGEKVDEFRDYRVALDVECEHANGSYLAGSARLDHCH